MKATSGMMRKIRFLARRLEFDQTQMYDFCETDSLRKLTTAQAGRKIEAMEALLAEMGKPNLPAERISGRQRALVMKYVYLLGWHKAHFWNWARKVLGHHLPVRGGDFEKFNWVSRGDGRKLVEGLKAIEGRRTSLNLRKE